MKGNEQELGVFRSRHQEARSSADDLRKIYEKTTQSPRVQRIHRNISQIRTFQAEHRGRAASDGIPSIGGMGVTLITRLLTPCVYCLVKEWPLLR